MSETITIIEARSPTLSGQLKAAWRFRHLFGFLFRKISVHRYRETMLGVWWLVVRPLIPALVTVAIFTKVVSLDTKQEPYPVFFFASYLTWNMFQATITTLPRSMMWMRSMMRRTYFPKVMLPAASLGPPLMEALVVFAVFVITVVYFGLRTGTWWVNAHPSLLLFPVCMLAALVAGLAVGMILMVLAAFIRDVVYTTPYFTQIFMLVTPVMYPIKFIPDQYRWLLYILNPLASIVECGRWALTGVGEPPIFYLLVSIPVILVVFVLSLIFFVRAEPFISDQV